MKKTTATVGLFVMFLLLGAAGQENNRLPNRIEDPVIVPGKSFPGLAGLPQSRLALFRYAGQYLPIPFQLDERDRAGQYVFVKGAVTGKDDVAGLDANDELVFMAFDAGGKAPASAPAGTGAGAEIEITDPVTGDRAYAYLFSFASSPPRSNLDYVTYDVDPAKGVRVQGQTYITQSPIGSIYYTYQSLRRADGTWTPDLADRLKIRGDLSALMGMVDAGYQFDDLVKSQVTGWIDGPVRVVRRGEGYLQVAGMDIRGAGDSIGYYYPSYFIYPMMIDFPVNLRTFLTDITIHGATDFTRAAFGAHYYDAQNPYNENIVLDGKMSAEEKKMNRTHDHGWLALVHPQWASIHRLFFPKEWSFIRKQVYYRDDPTFKDPPEDDPGEFAVGYEFTNFIGVSKGAITYYMHYYFPANFKVGDEKRILDIQDRPLITAVTAIAPAGQ
jgi:hypothetical protein